MGRQQAVQALALMAFASGSIKDAPLGAPGVEDLRDQLHARESKQGQLFHNMPERNFSMGQFFRRAHVE